MLRSRDGGKNGGTLSCDIAFHLSFLLDNRWHFRQTFDLESLGRFEEGRQLILGNIHLTSIHELQDCLQVGKGHIFQNDDRVFRWIFLYTQERNVNFK